MEPVESFETPVSAAVCGMALLSALASQGFSERTLAASLLAMSCVVFMMEGVLYAGSAFLNWKIDEASAYLYLVERLGILFATWEGIADSMETIDYVPEA